MTPRVSVITIFYNAEKHFREAIDSVLAQDFEDFELLLIDDGSTDSSTAIALEYAERDARVRYFEHPGHANRGMSATRNLGLSHARGEFVAFIDADDRWRSSKLKEQVALLDAMPEANAVGGAVNYWASHAGGKDRIVPTGHVRGRAISPPEATLALYPLGKADAPSMSELMFRRASIRGVCGFEERFTGAYEDQAFLAKFYLSSTLYLAEAVCSDYRIHADSCMARAHRERTYNGARRSFLAWFESYLDGTPHRENAAIRRALRQALRRYGRPRLRAAIRGAAPDTLVSLVRAGRSALARIRPLLAPGPAILMYHRVADESFDPWGLAVSPANFADQLKWLAANRTVLPLAEFAQLQRRGKLPRDAIALTFDDGYACNKDVAVPLLEKYRVPATIFLPAELIERGREFWWDELERIVLGHSGETLKLNGDRVPLGESSPDDRDWTPAQPPGTPRQAAYHRLWSILYERAPSDLDRAMEELRQQAGLPGSPRKSHRPMSSDEIAGIHSDFVEFGSHSMRHASLPHLSHEEKAREIGESIGRCAELTGREPRTFAYPYGDFDRESARLVAEAGFECACLADGWFVGRRTDPFALPRIFVGNWDSARLARQLGRP
jgi:peptidoglycan/xylan/chitin deacetylase (PgdA/CDA1 family)/glycosyltransferase involved in cell wall biosynthesis